ncbi:hypothetical protein GGR92_004348 [Spirosoma lacussanchae]|uniref:hypothetical protein n=1 Tax=Spirosoma lacussanchae TaxID=1884249 RepID=UPI001109A53D|nr:hypothetical protein [Spirosoma lacussanchae]
MPTTLSLHNPTPGLHWYVSKPLGTDQIAAIRDPQGGQTVKQPTSIPSPFARMDLVRSAFLNLALRPDLNGTINDQRIVSDCLDVGELFFNFDKLKTFVTITPFDVRTDLDRLRQSTNQGHRRLGDALKLFLDQDAAEYNFADINRLFILSYRGRVVGGTSPKTLFFSSGNDLSWVDVTMGNDRLFDQSVTPLHQRDIEYQKFWYAIKLFMPNFRDRFREVDDYLNRSRSLLQQQNPTMFYEHIESPNGQPLLTREKFDNDFDELTTGPGDVVEVLGFPLRKKKSDARAIDQVSDFIIKSKKYETLNQGKPRPMALQNRFFRPFTYVPQAQWNPNTPVPYVARESWRDNQRPLPGQPGNYPWLTVSDFLEPYLVRLPYPMDRGRFFDGNLQAPATDKGYLLPLKKDFFDFFDVDDLMTGRVRIRMTPQGAGVNVSLDIPVTAPGQPGNQFVTFERLYAQTIGNNVTAPNETTNEGIIIENSFTVNVYPFVRSGSVPVPADYRVQLIESGFDSQNQYELTYFGEKTNAEVRPESKHQRTVRQQNTDGSSVYYVLRDEFDYVQANIRGDGREVHGLLIPRWQVYNGGSKQFEFSVDFGTTNTHVEYKVDGSAPRPFEVAELTPQVATLVNPAQYNPALFELFLLYDLEFVPPTIGPGRPDNFPTRTAIAEPMNLSFNQQTQALADFNIPFYVERQPAGSNRITTNLKWAKNNDQTERRVEAFLEELLMLIKNKVLTEGGNLTQTVVYWFFPASMTPGRVSQLRTDWQELYDRYIGGAPGRLREVSESVAPFYYYKQNPTLSASARPVINVDIGGGTSDVVVYERNEPKLLTSFRFAGNAIYGDAFSEYGAASHNGFVRKYADRIQTLLDSQSLGNLSDNNRRMLETNRSEDIMAFWFSIEKSNDVKAKSMLSFNGMLAKDEDLKVVFVLFYTALLYHVARLMKSKGIGLPGALTFSGTGSKLLTIISTDDAMLGKLARAIFEKVYEQPYDLSGLTLFYERKGPKEVTCKGALMQPTNSRPVDTEAISYVYPATFNDEYPALTYADLRRPEVVDSLLKETNAFIDFFFALNQQFSFVRNLNVSARSLAVAQQELRTHLDTSLMDGIQRRESDVAAEYSGMTDALAAPIEETLFFYPLIGAINKLANALA